MPNGSNSSRLERCDSAVSPSHRSGFPCKPPLSKWDFNACPKGWEQRGCAGKAGQGWAVLMAEALVGTCGTMPALVPLGSSLQPFCLPAHGMAASLLAHCCSFPDAYRCFLFKGMDRWLQAVE